MASYVPSSGISSAGMEHRVERARDLFNCSVPDSKACSSGLFLNHYGIPTKAGFLICSPLGGFSTYYQIKAFGCDCPRSSLLVKGNSIPAVWVCSCLQMKPKFCSNGGWASHSLKMVPLALCVDLRSPWIS